MLRKFINNILKTNNDYICTELIAYAYYESGVKLFNNLNLDKVIMRYANHYIFTN